MHKKLFSTLSRYQQIILVGGGTGGHIQPILSIAHEIRGRSLLWIGGKGAEEETAAKNAKIEFKSISTLKLSTTKSWQVFLYPIVLIRGIVTARKILKRMIDIQGNGGSGGETVGARMKTESRGAEPAGVSFLTPEGFDTFSSKSMDTGIGKSSIAVFSKGGPGSVAVGIAAWSLGIPLYLHESDTIPGRSNRILGFFATRIFLGFESAKKYFNVKKTEVVGQILNPVFQTSFVKEVPEGRRISSGKQSKISPTPLYKEGLEWKTSKPHILVICGSQGSQIIFEEIIKNFSGDNRHEWIISLGKLNTGMRKDFEKIPDCQALEWISQEDIAHLIQETDIAITRGSATTLAELTAFEKKLRLIIIPLPYAAYNHQYYNALEYEKMGHTLLEQKNISQLTKLL